MSTVSTKLSRKSTVGRTGGRRLYLSLVHLNLWSVIKFSVVMGVISGGMLIIGVLILWKVLNAAGVFASIGAASGASSITALVALPRVMTVAFGLAVVGLLGTVIGGTIAGAMYNLSVRATGGLTVGFSSPE
ncbi:hypothetical protein BH09ACT1_BH09ACT1_07020 [soil metagenome]